MATNYKKIRHDTIAMTVLSKNLHAYTCKNMTAELPAMELESQVSSSIMRYDAIPCPCKTKYCNLCELPLATFIELFNKSKQN
ncbi:unnamed protein product [Coffea canephora]|uniref:Uncharacterized protein n=1 Tax=Coffea canephora TaxID=49390 RepID=A0A068UJ17_COFCA|nr:unnamed protein product [Coffea canephora]